MWRNPVMFVVEIGAVMTSVQLVLDIAAGHPDVGFELQITIWLWLTVLFANLAEAMAEGRGKAQAETLRKSKTETIAFRLEADGTTEQVPAPQLRKGDVVVVSAGRVHSRLTARSSKASRRSTSRRSPASPRP